MAKLILLDHDRDSNNEDLYTNFKDGLSFQNHELFSVCAHFEMRTIVEYENDLLMQQTSLTMMEKVIAEE